METEQRKLNFVKGALFGFGFLMEMITVPYSRNSLKKTIQWVSAVNLKKIERVPSYQVLTINFKPLCHILNPQKTKEAVIESTPA